MKEGKKKLHKINWEKRVRNVREAALQPPESGQEEDRRCRTDQKFPAAQERPAVEQAVLLQPMERPCRSSSVWKGAHGGTGGLG